MTGTLASVVQRHDVVVCAGSGGVGKTTTAATIALWGAKYGRRAAQVTPSPRARRQATTRLPPHCPATETLRGALRTRT